MTIETKYELTNLYFIYSGIIRYAKAIGITYREIHDSEGKEEYPLITYCFKLDKAKNTIQVDQNQVFKTRKELLKSLI